MNIEPSLESSTIFVEGYNHKNHKLFNRLKALEFGNLQNLSNDSDLLFASSKPQKKLSYETEEEYLAAEEYIHELKPVQTKKIKVNIKNIVKGKPSFPEIK